MSYQLACSSWGDEEIQAIKSVIDKDRYSMGEKVTEFERQFASYFRSKYAVMVNSGSSANLLAIAALCYKQENPLKPGDEVIVPSLSWSTTYYPVDQYGMKLVFVDIDITTLNIDVSLVESAITNKTKAIFVPHILGNPADISALVDLSRRHGLYLIEDNCESMGATVDGKYTGTFGICGTFSTFFSHHISTMEGGVIVTDDEEIYHILLCMRSHGWTRHLPSDNKVCKKTDDDFLESYRFVLPGYNVRPIEMMGAIGIVQLKKLDFLLEQRRKNAENFNSLFSGVESYQIQQVQDASRDNSSWFGFSFILAKNIDRKSVIQLLVSSGIEVRPIVCGNFLRNDVLKHLNHRVHGTHVNSDTVHNRGFFVGNDHESKIKQLTQLKDVLCFSKKKELI